MDEITRMLNASRRSYFFIYRDGGVLDQPLTWRFGFAGHGGIRCVVEDQDYDAFVSKLRTYVRQLIGE